MTGTVTFLFTDIEGSTLLWEQEPEQMRPALARHDALVRAAVVSNGGTVVKMTGDGVYAAFDDPVTALDAAVAIQRGLADSETTTGLALRVRCGLHLGEVERRDDDYFGGAVNRAARIMGAAHGGQILISHAMVERVRRQLPSSCSLRDLGTVRLKDLALPERVYQLVHPELRSDFPALRSLETTPNNLPQQISSFIGREQETAEVKRLLARSRLLTLVGIGGIGKTRLMLQAAADTHDAYPDGVWFVELASITDPLLVPSSIAQVLSVQERAGTALTQTLCNHLKSRRLLLVLDNCEHLIAACAALAASFLEAAPEIRILASSREPLQIAGEQIYVVPALSLPPANADLETLARSEAVQMLIERIRLQQPAFVATERQAAAITSICTHLDGIPLALELAAGRAHSLSIDEINVRLKDRFKLLTGGSRSALPRQQTLRATLDWSYELLADDERSVLNRLAVFCGGFMLASASAVASDETIDEFAVIDLLTHLVARSLVVAETNVAGSRYRLLDTARTYALEKLAACGEEERTGRRHAQYFCDMFARAAEDWMCTPDADWRASYLPERDNVRAALEWALEAGGDRAIGIALAGASGPLWTEMSLYGEGHQRLEAAVLQIESGTSAKDQARLWLWLGLNWALAAPDKAVPALQRAIVLYRGLGDERSLGFALARLAHEEAMAGRFDQAASALAEALPLVEGAGLPKILGDYFDYSAVLKSLTGDPAGARADLTKALVLYRDAGAERYALYTLAQLAEVAWGLGDLDAAVSGNREVVALLRKSSLTKVMLGLCLSNLAGVHTERGELDAALAAAREGLPLLMEGGFAWSHLDHLALRAALAGRIATAARIAGYSDSMYASRKMARQPNETRSRDRLQAMLQAKYAAGELEQLLAEGAKMSEDDACRAGAGIRRMPKEPESPAASRHAFLQRWVPGVAQLASYPPGALRGDTIAAFSVAVVMIPSVLAYAELAGLRPEAGLYAALGSMIVYALFTSTRRVIVGPDTTIALLAGSVIAPLALGDPSRAAALAAALALMSGVLLVVAGRIGLGNIADLLSTPVLVGYSAGAALILIGTQLPVLLGVALPRDAFFLRVYDAALSLPDAHLATVALGLCLIAVVLALARFVPRAPAALIACAIAIGASLALDLGARGVVHLASLTAAIPAPSLPDIALRDLQSLAPGAIALALLVFAEGIVMARTLAHKHREPVDADRELTALGAGNLAAGLVGGFVVGASTSRSVTADAAGAQTQLVQWIAAALLAAFVLLLAPALDVLPRVALSAVLVAAGLHLVDLAEWRTLLRLDRRALALAIAVALGVLLLGVLPGVILGVGLSLAQILLEVARPRDAILRRLPTDHRFHDLADDEAGTAAPGVVVYRLYAPILFANARFVAERLRTLVAEADPPARCVVFDLQAVPQIDLTALAIVRNLHSELEARGIDVRFARANRPLREQLGEWIGNEQLGRERFFPSASAAVDDFLAAHSTRSQ